MGDRFPLVVAAVEALAARACTIDGDVIACDGKNIFFLREEVLMYDAPESATFPRMFSSSARRF